MTGELALEVEERKEAGTVVVSPVGRLDGIGASHLLARVTAILGREGPRIVLDCARMTYISSAGLRVLVICAKDCRQEGGDLAIAALRPECRAVVSTTGLLSVLSHHETSEPGSRRRRSGSARRRSACRSRLSWSPARCTRMRAIPTNPGWCCRRKRCGYSPMQGLDAAPGKDAATAGIRAPGPHPQIGSTSVAWRPRGSSSAQTLTRCPGCSASRPDRDSTLAWTYTSRPPPSGVTKPKPLPVS